MIRQAFDALEAVVLEQGPSLGGVIRQDSADLLRVDLPVADSARFLDSARALEANIGVELEFSFDDEVATFVKTPQGDWRLDAEPSIRVELLGEDEDQHAWPASRVLQVSRKREMRAQAVIRLDKTMWRQKIEESTGRSCWIGYSEDSFGSWLEDRSWKQIAKELFARPAGIVMIHRWPGPPITLGPRLVVQGSDLKDGRPPPDDVSWPQSVESEYVRAAHLMPSEEGTSRDWMLLLLRTGARCAAELFVLANGAAATKESVGIPVLWDINDDQSVTPEGVEGVLALARWTSEEPVATRLAIAWRVAGERVTDPLSGPSASSLVTAADIAYGSATDAGVREALARQAELERSFREIDSAVTTAKEAMSSVIDTTVTRALAVVIGVGLTAVAADNFRGWLIGAVSTLVALYVLIQATVGLAMHKRDIQSRLDGFDVLVSHRGSRLAISVTQQIQRWREQAERRVRLSRVLLLVLSLVLFTGGMTAGVFTASSARSDNERAEGESSSRPDPIKAPTPERTRRRR